jgi:protein TonB
MKFLTLVLVCALCLVADSPKKLRIGGNVAAASLVTKVAPVYPPEAKASGVQGTVKLAVDIGTDGKIQHINVLSGPDVLVQSAVEAVQQWVYKPTLLNGEPVEVATTVDVNFTLTQ